MAIEDDVKTYLNISTYDTSKDAILLLYIRKANAAISKYLNDDTTDISTTYPDAVCQFVVEAVNRNGVEGMRQYMQGSRQGMVETSLSDMVKALLPFPYVSMMSAYDDGEARC